MINHFSKVMIFARFFKLIFPICSIILCMLIPNILFSGFLTWRSHSHFVKVEYMTRGPIERSVVCSSSLSRFLPYNNNPPYLCFPFFGKWYTYNRFCIICNFNVFMIVAGVINIMVFNATNKVCSLVSTWVWPFYITSF
jgi:hypothetical protein